MKRHLLKAGCLSLALFGLVLCVGCRSTPTDNRPASGEATSSTAHGPFLSDDISRFGATTWKVKGGDSFFDFDNARAAFGDQASPRGVEDSFRDGYQVFIRKRCIELGAALAGIDAEDPEVRAYSERTIDALWRADQATMQAQAHSPSPSGLVIPRYIAEELAKPRAEWNVPWLRIHGRLLQAAYDLESRSREKWELAVGKMLSLGMEGRYFLTSQMIKRLASDDPRFVELAQFYLAEYLAEEAIEPLVWAAHLQIGAQPGVYSRRTCATLERIGARAVPAMLKVFERKGQWQPADNGNWKTRRCIVESLGTIGDTRAVPVLIRELKGMAFDNSDTHYLYAEVVITALGKLGDASAVEPILEAWKQEPYLAKTATQAIFTLTGEIVDAPTSHAKQEAPQPSSSR